MHLFQSFHSRWDNQPRFGIALASGLLISITTVFSTAPAYASVPSVPMASVETAPYSRVFYNGSTYAVKDRDYDAGNASIGFSSLWIKKPANNDLQVSVQYCLKDPSLSGTAAELTGLKLISNNQPVLSIGDPIKAKLSKTDILRPGYYTSPYVVDDNPWLEYPFWDAMNWDFLPGTLTYVPPEYVPAKTCAVGASRFDISKLANKIAQLPNQTLQVQLNFSDGETQTWRLGKGTVGALKQLVKVNG